MSQLQYLVLATHGETDKWKSLSTLTAQVRAAGTLWDLKGQPGILENYTATIDLHRQFASHSPFGEPDLRSFYTPERVAVETLDGDVLEERINPRAAFAGHTLQTPWDRLHAAYFTGYAMWNYLTEPFTFTHPGFSFAELDPWHEDGETWRRLQVTFPDSVHTHSRVQTYYIDRDGLIRRHDYFADVLGPADLPSAHYSSGHQHFDGFVFPTQRRVHLTDASGHKLPEPVIVAIDLDHITLG